MIKVDAHPPFCLCCGAPTTDTDEDGWMECLFCGVEYVVRKNKLVGVSITANNGGVAIAGNHTGNINIGGDVIGGDKIVKR